MKTYNMLCKTGARALLMGIITVQNADATLTWTTPLTLSSANVVGTVKGLAGDNPGNDAIYFAQELLDLSAGSVNISYVDASSGAAHIYNTSSTEYSGTLIGGTHMDSGDLTAIAANYDYVIANMLAKMRAGFCFIY